MPKRTKLRPTHPQRRQPCGTSLGAEVRFWRLAVACRLFFSLAFWWFCWRLLAGVWCGGGMASIVSSAARSALCADAGSSPRRATSFLAARQERRQRNVPCSQRPQKLRFANLSGQPAVAANTGVRHNSLRAEALHSNRCRKSEHEVWLSCGSQTTAVCCVRRRWKKGVWASKHPTACESCACEPLLSAA